MKAIHIKHPALDSIEYYFCEFTSDKDIKDFQNTCPQFDLSELRVEPGDKIVLKHQTKDPQYYERLTPAYFSRFISQKAEAYNAIAREMQNFFN